MRSRKRVAVGGRVQRRVGDRVVERHAVDGGHADARPRRPRSRPAPSPRTGGRWRSTAAPGRRSSRPARTRARRGGPRRAARSPASWLARPARLDEVGRPDPPTGDAQRALGVGEQVVDQVDLLGVLDLGEHDAVERAARPARERSTRRPQQRVQLPDGRLEVRPGGRKKRSVAARRRDQSASREHVDRVGAARAAASSRVGERVLRVEHDHRRAARLGEQPLHERRRRRRAGPPARPAPTPKRSRMRAIGAVPPSRALRAMSSSAGVVKWACWRQ